MLVGLIAAMLLGAVVGYQRERPGKAAELRTHILVALGPALFVVAAAGGQASGGAALAALRVESQGQPASAAGPCARRLAAPQMQGSPRCCLFGSKLRRIRARIPADGLPAVLANVRS